MPLHFAAPLIRSALVIAVGASSLAASAQIHRCKDDKGQTVLSDRPCAVSAEAQQAAPKSTAGGAVDRIAAPQMVSARTRDMSAQYDFIPSAARQGTQAPRATK